MRKLLLASSSRYRAELLARLGVPFETDVPDVDESPRAGEAPADLCLRLAEAKARAVAARHPGALVIGSDQVADCGGVAIGKPGTLDKAREQLRRLAARTVTFHTGIAVLDTSTGACLAERVDIESVFRALTGGEIDAYLAREPALDCAGSVRSEALGIVLFDRIRGDDPSALVGLPLIATARLLRAAGFDVLARR